MRHRSSRPLRYFQPQPAYDDHTPRRNQDSGGAPYAGRVRGGRPGIEYVDYRPTTQDSRIHRERGPWWHTGNYIPAADPLRWTEAGPIRPELHMRTFAWRRWSGGRHGDRTGWHTQVPTTANVTTRRKAQQKRPHANRLTVPGYRGQSFSQLTQTINRGQ